MSKRVKIIVPIPMDEAGVANRASQLSVEQVRDGYDVEQLAAVRDVTTLPVIASGGAGRIEHFEEVFKQARVDGALAASVFHSAEINIGELKSFLNDSGLDVRP